MKVYFDNAASTMVRDEAVKAMADVMTDNYGNPSSMHEYGRRALTALEEARCSVAAAINAPAAGIYFTSGGTEANNLAILGTLTSSRSINLQGRHIISSATEHSAVKAPLKRLEDNGFEVTYLLPDKTGRIPVDAFADALREDTVFATIMLVNNDTGAVNTVHEYALEIKNRGLSTILHTDAVQGLCKIPVNAKTLGADLITLSSHKLHGPKGIGALYVSDRVKLSPMILGGEHERGKRGGTEALPAAAGFGTAVKYGHKEFEETSSKVRSLRDHAVMLINKELPEAVIIGEGDSPYILCVSLPGYKSEVLMNYLDGEGIYVSKGAACKKGARSPTLEAMKLRNDVIDGALRVSFSRYSTGEEVEHFVDTLRTATKVLVR